MDTLVKTNILAKKRKQTLEIRNAMLPAARKKKARFKTLGGMVKHHVKAKFRQRKLHHMEVNRIHEDRERESHHLKRKHEEMKKMKEKKKRQLQERLNSRKNLNV